ncbi:RNA ligase family protein [Deinococcus soli (ex Cha et al. 2016)]|uniref:2'-5' RNA ligase n=1 Tax=Deinococcus soli (ex Cha et al. 2016) TaxID=1309411 RepID=A0A0F7JPD7_9DEIO|nr:RNA ligase family protein [Deinococcus soli (ex Cha et al. 2016)]AKH17134.1 2'-5' RNA ligase [Deinococcus soli (ex Cha et al. 2016)]
MRVKYPSTPHLPWSPGLQNDDRRIPSLRDLEGQEVVVTEKLDGENTSLYRADLHARSLDTRPHPSRTWVKAERGRFGHEIPPGWRLCGENVFAVHSLRYEALAGYFYLFSVWDDRNVSRPWAEVRDWAARLDVPTPRELYRGVWDEAALRALTVDTARMEGYVVRVTGEIPYAQFGRRVAKWVRAGHVQTDEHWLSRPVERNGLRDEPA